MFKYLFHLGTREAMIPDPANTQEDSFKNQSINQSSKILFRWYNAKSPVDGKIVYAVESR